MAASERALSRRAGRPCSPADLVLARRRASWPARRAPGAACDSIRLGSSPASVCLRLRNDYPEAHHRSISPVRWRTRMFNHPGGRRDGRFHAFPDRRKRRSPAWGRAATGLTIPGGDELRRVEPRKLRRPHPQGHHQSCGQSPGLPVSLAGLPGRLQGQAQVLPPRKKRLPMPGPRSRVRSVVLRRACAESIVTLRWGGNPTGRPTTS